MVLELLQGPHLTQNCGGSHPPTLWDLGVQRVPLGWPDICMDLSGIAASEVELGGISMDEVIIEHRSLIMIARV